MKKMGVCEVKKKKASNRPSSGKGARILRRMYSLPTGEGRGGASMVLLSCGWSIAFKQLEHYFEIAIVMPSFCKTTYFNQ